MRQGIRRWVLGATLGALLLGGSWTGRAAALPAAHPKPIDAWRDDILYLILPDRFYDADASNDLHVDRSNPFAYHGGDLAGVIRKLDYIKSLGVTAIWLTPVVDNQDNPLDGKYWGYHGYWIKDFEKVDEHLGDEATLKKLVQEAHARGLKVLMDAVVNHPGYDAPFVRDEASASWFHHNGNITNWDDPYQNENFDVVGLPDFNSENAQVLGFMERVWGGWIKRVGVDGFRLDTVRHVPIPFWSRFTRAMHQQGGDRFLLLGEVSYHDAHLLPPYLERAGLDSLFDFHMFEVMREVFARGKSPRSLSEGLKLDRLYPDATHLVPFIDSHDEVRFLTAAGGDQRRLRLALAFLMTMRGVPMIYAGTEVAMPGGQDPDNRRDMAWGTHPEMLAYTRKLTGLHRELPALRHGAMQELYADDAVYAFRRGSGPDQVVVVLNNTDRPQVRDIRLPDAVSGGRYTDRLGKDDVTVRGGKLHVALDRLEARILVPTARP